MQPVQLYRAAAAAALLGGAGIVVLDLAQTLFDVPRRTVSLIELPITLCVLLALPGLYVRQAPRIGYFGFVAFLLTFTGVALGMGHFYLLAFARSVITPRWPDAAAAVDASARLVAPAEFITFILGWLFFGISSIRGKVFPRIPAFLLVSGILLVLARAFVPLPGPVGGVLMGVAIAWFGNALFRNASVNRLDPPPNPSLHRTPPG